MEDRNLALENHCQTAEDSRKEFYLKALRESEERYRQLISEMPNAFVLCEVIKDENGRPSNFWILDANPAFEHVTGIKRKNVVGKTALELLPWLDSPFIEKFGEVALTESSFHFERYSRGFNKHFRGKAFCIEKGKVALILEDMQNFLQIKEKSKRPRNELETLLKNTRSRVMSVDHHGNIERINHDMLGLTPDEAIGQCIYDYCDEDDRILAEKAVQRVFQSGEFSHNEVIFVTPNGQRGCHEIHMGPVVREGKIVAATIIASDISERKILERDLRTANDRLMEILDKVPFGVVIIGKDKKIRWANEETKKLIGLKQEEIMGKCCNEFLCPADQSICTVIDEGLPVDKAERILRSKDGYEYPILKNVLEIDMEGEVVFLETFFDITGFKQMETELSHARKLESVGQLASGIAHEINTPAQFVGDNISFLRDAFKDLFDLQEKQRKLLKEVKSVSLNTGRVEEVEQTLKTVDIEYLSDEIPKAIDQSLEGITRISNIVRAMKEFSHPGSNELTATDINKAIETTVAVTRNEWKYVSEVEMEMDPTLPPVPCLVNEWNQVILNLIINARDAIADVVGDDGTKGKITISTRQDDKWAEIRVSDTGSGIPGHFRGRIFDPFFTTKEVGKGSGQGLAIAYNVIRNKHRGELLFETEEGKGTTFIIRLPLN